MIGEENNFSEEKNQFYNFSRSDRFFFGYSDLQYYVLEIVLKIQFKDLGCLQFGRETINIFYEVQILRLFWNRMFICLVLDNWGSMSEVLNLEVRMDRSQLWVGRVGWSVAGVRGRWEKSYLGRAIVRVRYRGVGRIFIVICIGSVRWLGFRGYLGKKSLARGASQEVFC